MERLPILNDDYPYFSWDSTEYAIKSYEAITTKGQTSDFSYLVWNEIVDKLHEIMVTANLAWDDKYESYQNTRIAQYGELKASMFNSVIYNITSMINTVWRWSYNSSNSGYVGRTYFYGTRQKENKADEVYGWYFLELTKNLNVLIDVLKGKIIQDMYNRENESIIDLTVFNAPGSKVINSSEEIKIYDNSVFIAPDSRVLIVTEENNDSNNTVLNNPDSRVYYSVQRENTSDNVYMISPEARVMFDVDINNSDENADMNAPKAGVMYYSISERDNYISNGNLPDSFLLDSVEHCFDAGEAILKAPGIYYIALCDIDEDSSKAIGTAASPNYAYNKEDNADLESSYLIDLEPCLINVFDCNSDYENSILSEGIPKHLKITDYINTYGSASMMFYEGWLYPYFTKNKDLYVQQVYSSVRTGNRLKIE